MKNFALRFALCTFVAIAFSLNAVAQTAAGQIKAAKIEGQVMKLSADGSTAAVKDGDLLTESDTITTGKSSGVVLVFMNGSSVKLGADSRLAIDEFKMDPLAVDVSAASLKSEPSVSKTTLNLSYGEMVGDVKKLNASSSYSIKTPVGAAGIRGTIYRIVFRPGADGKAFFTISTAEGLVLMIGVTNADISIGQGKEVTVEIDTDNPTNPIFVSQDIPAATRSSIDAISQELAQALAGYTISNPPPPGSTGSTVLQTPPPPDTPPPPLTPGAGKP